VAEAGERNTLPKMEILMMFRTLNRFGTENNISRKGAKTQRRINTGRVHLNLDGSDSIPRLKIRDYSRR
jgi:hypothetical protein